MGKQEEYLRITKQIIENVGGVENIQGVAHCATRLRLVLKDNDLANMEGLENVDKVKGTFVAGNQLQMIFGAGLVTEIYDFFAKYTHMENMSLDSIKQQSAQKQNPIQAVIKSLSDVFIGIMPAILAAALLLGLTGVLGNLEVVKNNDTLFAINKLASLASSGIFSILPMAVCYSAVKRYGGNPILGMVVGAIMLDSSLANAYDAAKGLVTPEVINLFGLHIELVGFQGGIIIALMMGFIVAKLDIFFNKKIPDVVKLLFAPLLTVFISTVLLFTIIGPAGRLLSNGITNGLVWMTDSFGVFGYAIFGGVQQIIVITGLHHLFGAVEAQLLADTGTNFINPLMSVALMGQGGAVLGYLFLHWSNVKTRELCIPSFISTLFGISEPAIFGVNLRYKFPLIGGCIGGAAAGAYVYLSGLTSLGFGTTAVPGLAIANPANNGYLNYIIAHIIALGIGLACTVVFGKTVGRSAEPAPAAAPAAAATTTPAPTAEVKVQQASTGKLELCCPIQGTVKDIAQSSDPAFASKAMGDGFVIDVTNGVVKAPCDAKISFVFPSCHAVGLELADGTNLLIHCGVNTVQLDGEGFTKFVDEAQTVTKGQKLLSFDKAFIESKGYSSEVLVIFADVPDGRSVEKVYTGAANTDKVLAVIS